MNLLLKDRIVRMTSALCLLPLLYSILIFPSLPLRVAVQWNSEGEPIRTLSREMAAFGFPIFFFLTNLFSKLFLFADPKHYPHSQPPILLIFSTWISPILSMLLVPWTLTSAIMNLSFPTALFSFLPGIMFIFFGNYLPKCRQNYTIGIKIPWTLHNEKNWNKTHHFAGYLWIVSGTFQVGATIVSFFIHVPLQWITLSSILICIFLPIVYSFTLYQKQSSI